MVFGGVSVLLHFPDAQGVHAATPLEKGRIAIIVHHSQQTELLRQRAAWVQATVIRSAARIEALIAALLAGLIHYSEVLGDYSYRTSRR